MLTAEGAPAGKKVHRWELLTSSQCNSRYSCQSKPFLKLSSSLNVFLFVLYFFSMTIYLPYALFHLHPPPSIPQSCWNCENRVKHTQTTCTSYHYILPYFSLLCSYHSWRGLRHHCPTYNVSCILDLLQ